MVQWQSLAPHRTRAQSGALGWKVGSAAAHAPPGTRPGRTLSTMLVSAASAMIQHPNSNPNQTTRPCRLTTILSRSPTAARAPPGSYGPGRIHSATPVSVAVNRPNSSNSPSRIPVLSTALGSMLAPARRSSTHGRAATRALAVLSSAAHPLQVFVPLPKHSFHVFGYVHRIDAWMTFLLYQ
ncbi:hypothetical protein F5888DRAFT_1724064 [Russula emetica]|nr:hypothetical protein F5888DRAFT_1724064 [Russula emetica]